MANTYVITGCNRGLGLEFVRQLVARGEHVIGTARNPEGLEGYTESGVKTHALDVSNIESIERFSETMSGQAIDVLINNAGVGVHSKPFESLDFNEMEEFFATNTLGALRVFKALLPALRRGSLKKVVNLTSKMGSIGDNSSGAAYSYRVSKAGLNMATRSLAIDYRAEGFICVVVHPGWVATDMGGSGAPVTPEESISGMLGVIDGLTPEDSGEHIDFTGARVPW